MPRGNFIPLEPIDRFFGRLQAFQMECPRCGKLLLVGKGQPHDKFYNRVTSVMQCPFVRPRDQTTVVTRLNGCGKRFLVGIVAWPIRHGNQPKARPPDHVPTDRQLNQIRQFARGIWARIHKQHGENLNTIQPETDLPGDEDGS